MTELHPGTSMKQEACVLLMKFRRDLAELATTFGCLNHKVVNVQYMNIHHLTLPSPSPGVCPDILTIGKPMGNGHPVSGVVTTQKYMKTFAEFVGQRAMERVCAHFDNMIVINIESSLLYL